VTVHHFTLHVDGLELDDATVGKLLAAGCDDATFGRIAGQMLATFDREAPTFAQALASAVAAIEDTVPGSRVVGLEREGELAAS
jgi:hypothetical protein